jgi:SPP1 family predicted phage head-tail adaptor
MRAGTLRHRITIQQQTVTRDTFGGETITWADLATVWASKAHKSSREFFAAQKINAETQELFVVRYRSGVTAKMRVSYDNRYYDIIGAYDPDGRKRELHLLCKEVI